MALAENLHHSRQKVEGGEHDGPRAQKTARATGAQPGVLTEPEPQGGAVTVSYVLPRGLLSTPLLADTAAEAVDARTVKFLLQKTLARKKEEEEEERRKEVAKQQEEKHEAKMKLLNDRVRHDLPLTEAEWAAWRQWMGLVPSSSSSARRRKKKKRRKRRLPRGVRIRRCGHGRALFLRGSVSLCSLAYCRSGRAGRRQWQWYVLGWFFWCSSRCVPFYCRLARVVQTVQKVVQFLDQLFSPVVVQRQVPDSVRTVQHCPWRFHRCCSWMRSWSLRQVPWSYAAVPQLQFIVGRRHPFRSADADPRGPGCSADHRVSQVAVRWSMSPLCGGADSQVLPWRCPWRSRSCSSLRKQFLSTTPRIW